MEHCRGHHRRDIDFHDREQRPYLLPKTNLENKGRAEPVPPQPDLLQQRESCTASCWAQRRPLDPHDSEISSSAAALTCTTCEIEAQEAVAMAREAPFAHAGTLGKKGSKFLFRPKAGPAYYLSGVYSGIVCGWLRGILRRRRDASGLRL